jgi:hypothetical protein
MKSSVGTTGWRELPNRDDKWCGEEFELLEIE